MYCKDCKYWKKKTVEYLGQKVGRSGICKNKVFNLDPKVTFKEVKLTKKQMDKRIKEHPILSHLTHETVITCDFKNDEAIFLFSYCTEGQILVGPEFGCVHFKKL